MYNPYSKPSTMTFFAPRVPMAPAGRWKSSSSGAARVACARSAGRSSGLGGASPSAAWSHGGEAAKFWGFYVGVTWFKPPKRGFVDSLLG